MTAQPREWRPLWPMIEPRIIQAQPNGRLPRANADGWIGPIRSPLRKEDKPSFSILPDSDSQPGGFEDHGTGEKGPLSKLAQLMNIDPRVSATTPAAPAALTLEAFCDQRKLDQAGLVTRWNVQETQWKGRPALRYSTTLGIDRIKYLDKGKGLDKYIWAGTGGSRHWYGLKGALALGVPLYLVNGEPSVWACQQQGVAAICLCGGEGAAPTGELVAELRAAGVAEVRVVYDRDDKGRAGAPKAVAALQEGGIVAAAYDLPAHLGETGDVDDLHRWEGVNLGTALAALPKLADPGAPVRKLLHASELSTLPKPRDLIPGVLSANKLNLIFGLPGAGKSQINLDIALSVAQFANVIYLAGEDAEDYQARVEAWQEQHNLDAGGLHFWPEPVNLLNPAAVDAFLAEVNPLQPALIIFDTLANCLVGADENSTKEMGQAIDTLNFIRRQTTAAILVCHHTGWSDTHERGSSALRGAVRVAMKVAQSDDGLISLTCEKSNNAAAFEPRHFRLIPKANSVALVPSSKLTGRDAPLKQKHYDLLEALNLPIFKDGASFTQLVEHTSFPKSTVNHALSKLLDRGYVACGEGRNKIYELNASGRHELQAYMFNAEGPSSTQVQPQFKGNLELALNWTVSILENDEASSTQVQPSSTKFNPSSTQVQDPDLGTSEFSSMSPPYKGDVLNSEQVEHALEQIEPPGESLPQHGAADMEYVRTRLALEDYKAIYRHCVINKLDYDAVLETARGVS